MKDISQNRHIEKNPTTSILATKCVYLISSQDPRLENTNSKPGVNWETREPQKKVVQINNRHKVGKFLLLHSHFSHQLGKFHETPTFLPIEPTYSSERFLFVSKHATKKSSWQILKHQRFLLHLPFQ